jgi:hypothetical protein
MYGLSPNQRSRLIFQKLPVTFGDGQLCIHDHNIRFGDRARAQVVSTDRRTGMNRRIEPPTGDIASWVITTNNGHAGQKRCFYCHKVGHLRRNCRVRLEALRTTPVESTSVPLKWQAPRRNGIVGVRTFKLPRVTVQLGHLTTQALWDSGSVRSIISQKMFKQLQRVDPTLRYGDKNINCISISRQTLWVVGDVGLHLKTRGFSWNFPLVAVQGSACELILGSDFISKTGLVLDISKQEFYFHFAPQKFRLALHPSF